MADDAGATIWKRDALNLPVIGLGRIDVGTPPDRALRVVGLHRRERVAEASNDLRGEGVRPDKAQYFGEVAPDQRPNVFEHLLRTVAHLDKAEIRIDRVDTER